MSAARDARRCARTVRLGPARLGTVRLGGAVITLVALVGCARPASVPAAMTTPDPKTIAAVGPLFDGSSTSIHTCTAAVVDSPAGNVILTAAHCVTGSGAGMVFVPGYDDGRAPYGSWVVTGAYAPAGWLRGQDPESDYAFLVVKPLGTNATGASVASAAGAEALGLAPTAGQRVTVAAYQVGSEDQPVICAAAVYLTQGYPTFDCPGYIAGTSGGPWIAGYDAAHRAGTITGVIGGLDQGGCTADTSYSPSFTTTASQVLVRAVAGGPADVLPVPDPIGC